jgi:hypothetical protein
VEEDQPDWLGRHGGWILVIFGAVLVAVAVVFRKEQAVASILSFSGVAAVIFGVLLSRLEGSFEFGPTKFAATLRAVRSAGIREDLTLEEKANLILGVVDVRGDEHPETIAAGREESTTGLRAPRDGQAEAGLQDVPLPRPIPFVVPGATDQVHGVGLGGFRRSLQHDGVFG